MTVSTLPFASTAPPVRALLVDRDPATRRMYAEYFAYASWVIEEADDGREALAKAITSLPDIIVTNTRLPGINGFDLCTLLRRDAATRAIPIVVVTGDTLDADVKRAHIAGADAVLVNPCLPETLLTEIRRLLEQSSSLRERSRLARERLHDEFLRSDRLIERSREMGRRTMLSKTHTRHDTTTPSVQPPALVCPDCDLPLRYLRSHIGGVNARNPEQWDYFECTRGCGSFQYRERTRKLRKV
jgi:DNA-binding response OmpR family regulator